MKLLLVEANDDRSWVGAHVRPQIHVVPLGLLSLAAYVRATVPGVDIQIAESSLDAATDEAWDRLLDAVRPDWVGIRSIHLFAREAARLAQGAARWGVPRVVLGGPLATALGPAVFSVVPELDLAVVGEGEHALACLLEGAIPKRVPGVIVREGDMVCPAPLEPAPLRADDLPTPAYDLVDLDRYAKHLSYAYNHRRQGVLATSRGCPYRCTFCFRTSNAPVRMQSAGRVLRDIERLAQEHGVRDVYVVDDVFNLRRDRAIEILDGLVARQLGVRLYFVNGLRTDLCDEQLIDRMVEAGTCWVTFGVETVHPRIAALIRKPLDPVHAARVIAHAQRSGIVVNIDTMFGFPTETREEADATLRWLSSLPHPSLLPYHFNLRGYPGCEIVEQAVAAGWDREAFLGTGFGAYHSLPMGSPTFSRREMMEHMLQYHRELGLSNREHVQWSVRVLQGMGYTDEDVVDMYSVLANRRVGSVGELLFGREAAGT